MAQDLYADQVANIREKLARLQEEKVESYDDLANTITENYNEKIKGYEDKWKAVADAGGEELAGMVGAKCIYSGGKKLLDLYAIYGSIELCAKQIGKISSIILRETYGT